MLAPRLDAVPGKHADPGLAAVRLAHAGQRPDLSPRRSPAAMFSMWFLTARKLKWDEGLLVGFVLVRLRPQQVARCGRQVRAGEWCDNKTVCHHPPTQHRDQPTHSQHYTAYRQHHGHGKIGTASAALMRACLNISLI